MGGFGSEPSGPWRERDTERRASGRVTRSRRLLPARRRRRVRLERSHGTATGAALSTSATIGITSTGGLPFGVGAFENGMERLASFGSEYRRLRPRDFGAHVIESACGLGRPTVPLEMHTGAPRRSALERASCEVWAAGFWTSVGAWDVLSAAGTTTGCTVPLPPTDSRSCRRRVPSPGLTFTRTRRGWRSTAMRSAPIRSSAGSVVDAVRVRRRARRESDRGVLRLRKYGVVARVIAATDAAPERPERSMATSRMLRVLAGSTALIVSPRPSTVFPDRTAVGVEAMPSHRHAAADADACPGRGGLNVASVVSRWRYGTRARIRRRQ